MRKLTEYFNPLLPSGSVIADSEEKDNLFVIWGEQLYCIGFNHGVVDIDTASKSSIQEGFQALINAYQEYNNKPDIDLNRFTVLSGPDAKKLLLEFFEIKDTSNVKNKKTSKPLRAKTNNRKAGTRTKVRK